MAGVMLIGMGLARLGRLMTFIPHPVTTGFTAGIALVIATLQLKDVLGLELVGAPESFFDRLEHDVAGAGHPVGLGARCSPASRSRC